MQKYVLFAICFIALGATLSGQKLKRQVISGLATQFTKIPGTTHLTAVTVAQPPSAGTLNNDKHILRQGFQQPPNTEFACPINIQYSINTTTVPGCGTYYVFEYTGNITPTTIISWNFGADASPSSHTGPISPNVAFFEKGSQPITITVSDGTCQKNVTTIVNAQSAPFYVKALLDHPYCFGQLGTINLVPAHGTPPYIVNWSNGAVTEDLIQVKSGAYQYTVTDQRGCKATEKVTLIGSDQPLILKSTVLDETCHENNDGSVELSVLNGAQPVTFQWSNGSREPIVTSLDSGLYQLTIKDALGCKIDTAFRVKTFCELEEEEFIPDTFSPNGDAANEFWEIPILSRFPDHTVNIFNRWGSLIWSTKGNFKGWDGTNTAGEKLPIGAYYYVIELGDNRKRVYKGSVTIIR